MDAFGLPIRSLITQGTAADCTQAASLIEGISAEHLLADNGYDSDTIIEQAKGQDMSVVIPPRKNRKEQREYVKYIYRHYHLVENAFLHLKRWPGIATRYAKNAASFLAAVHLRCLMLWLAISRRHYLGARVEAESASSRKEKLKNRRRGGLLLRSVHAGSQTRRKALSTGFLCASGCAGLGRVAILSMQRECSWP